MRLVPNRHLVAENQRIISYLYTIVAQQFVCSSIIFCIAGFFVKYLCLIGLSSRIVTQCSTICDTPANPSNLDYSSSRNRITQDSTASVAGCSGAYVITANASPALGVTPTLLGESMLRESQGVCLGSKICSRKLSGTLVRIVSYRFFATSDLVISFLDPSARLTCVRRV